MNTRVQIPQKPAAAASHFTRAPSDAGKGVAPPIVPEVLRSPGQPLDPAPHAFTEPRFGHDFSRVRVQADRKAPESASAINPLAYMAFKAPVDSLPGAGGGGSPTYLNRDGKSTCDPSSAEYQYCPIRSRAGSTGCRGCSRAADRSSAKSPVTSMFLRKGGR